MTEDAILSAKIAFTHDLVLIENQCLNSETVFDYLVVVQNSAD